MLGEKPDVEPKEREIEMAKQVIDSLSTDFDPSSYKDEHRAQLLALIERKAAGEDIVSTEAEAPKPTKAPDLMAALEESLAAIKGEELSGGGKRKASAAKSRSRSTKPKAPAKAKAKASKATTKAKSKSRARSAK